MINFTTLVLSHFSHLRLGLSANETKQEQNKIRDLKAQIFTPEFCQRTKSLKKYFEILSCKHTAVKPQISGVKNSQYPLALF